MPSRASWSCASMEAIKILKACSRHILAIASYHYDWQGPWIGSRSKLQLLGGKFQGSELWPFSQSAVSMAGDGIPWSQSQDAWLLNGRSPAMATFKGSFLIFESSLIITRKPNITGMDMNHHGLFSIKKNHQKLTILRPGEPQHLDLPSIQLLTATAGLELRQGSQHRCAGLVSGAFIQPRSVRLVPWLVDAG